MKIFMVTLGLAVLLCCLFSSTEAGPERQKRAVSLETCPENTTLEECKAYVQVKLKTKKVCLESVVGGVPPHITWNSCGSLACGLNLKKVPGDLSKPYPKCCDSCEVEDDSKPGVISAVG